MKARTLPKQLPTHGRGVASVGSDLDGAPTQYEGGIHIPLIVRWPGKVKPGSQCDVPVQCHRLLSHLCLAGRIHTRRYGSKPLYAYEWLRYHSSNKKLAEQEVAPGIVADSNQTHNQHHETYLHTAYRSPFRAARGQGPTSRTRHRS